MPHRQSHLRFIRRVHRRWVGWCVVESAGIGLVIGAGMAFVLLPMVVWQERPMIGVSMVMLAIGAIAGSVWGLTHRPTVIQTAMRIDRQFGLHDLLSTVLRPDAFNDAQFASILAAQADAACDRHRANDLMLRRLGGRAWGGIGIAAALLLTVSLLGSQSADSIAATPTARGLVPMDLTLETSSRSVAQRQPLARPERESARPAHDLRLLDENDQASEDPAQSTSPRKSSQQSLAGAPTDAAGATAGRTARANVPEATRQTPRRAEASDGVQTAPGVETGSTSLPRGSAGTGAEVAHRSVRDASPAKTDLNDNSAHHIEHRLNTDPTLAGYRDTVRDYFDMFRQ